MGAKSILRADDPPASEGAWLPEESLIFLREAYHAIRRLRVEILQGFDLSLSEYTTLRICAHAPAMPSEIAEAVDVTAAGATDIIDRLEKRHLVIRMSHPKDRRALLVATTTDGRRLYEKARSAQLERFRQVRQAMTVAERNALRIGLTALVRSLPSSRLNAVKGV